MKGSNAFLITLVAMAVFSTNVQYARPQSDDAAAVGGPAEPRLELTAAQRNAIYQAVSKDKSKVAKQQFAPVVGADVPPMIELYSLPDDAVADNPAAKFYQYTMVQDQVVLIDPTKMRVIATIGPTAKQ